MEQIYTRTAKSLGFAGSDFRLTPQTKIYEIPNYIKGLRDVPSVPKEPLRGQETFSTSNAWELSIYILYMCMGECKNESFIEVGENRGGLIPPTPQPRQFPYIFNGLPLRGRPILTPQTQEIAVISMGWAIVALLAVVGHMRLPSTYAPRRQPVPSLYRQQPS